ncbi:hypothetical protein [Lentzea terrae]|uniref:hypothetical protein n=1 Tax=Lentzea terrae TaxID=2200761 RepID=UPI001300800F|nr:hypothetical protein [Lentzea terrae]
MDIPIQRVMLEVADRDRPEVVTGSVLCWMSTAAPGPGVDLDNEQDITDVAIAWFRKIVLPRDPGCSFTEVQCSVDNGLLTLAVPCTGAMS